jgi:CheY-like chemotaxis protein
MPQRLDPRENLMPIILVVAPTEARYRLVHILRQAGHKVVEADSEESALEKVHSVSPELILMAIVMPESNGLEVAARLRQYLSSDLPPIILLGTITPIGIDEEPLSSLVDGYLDIDVSPNDLLAAVRSHVALANHELH